MFPPSSGYDFDIEAISGICGSISIACWVVVFSPQIIENFRRSSAEGLSMEFLVIWLAGDFFNIIGAVLQKVLPTMIILAIYYTFADILLIAQCFYYRGFSFRDPKSRKPAEVSNGSTSERTPLIGNGHANGHAPERLTAGALDPTSRTRSQSSFRDRFASLDGTGLSPATPMHPQPKDADETEALKPSQPRSWIQAILFNSTAIVLVVLAGVAGYYLSPSQPPPSHHGTTPADDQAQSLHFSFWGQIFGYICAVFYLGSRVPQILLNYRRKSTEGLNALFFIFACFGNLTYVCSILAFEPICSSHRHGHWHESHCKPGEAYDVYKTYILVNLSWLIGSAGTLGLDFAVFTQFFLYRNNISDNKLAAEDVPRRIDGEGRGREPNER
ncbi:hypothetical protein LTR09_001594 [Extremus antarcticus]|uniref:PQ-loop-domain-containing protein n=1 Tax=Extremus antarcticus TaxID=702011 RepID=A0AAJ0GH74_9PEZI|nr:hypothetical protein LTR09_001594 [Extremus antarcticus]